MRGVPWGTPAMTSLRDLSEYEGAEILRKKLEACLVGSSWALTSILRFRVYRSGGKVVGRL